MKKLKLDLETLEVTSFDTDAAEGEPRGTVQGNSLIYRTIPYSPLCAPVMVYTGYGYPGCWIAV